MSRDGPVGVSELARLTSASSSPSRETPRLRQVSAVAEVGGTNSEMNYEQSSPIEHALAFAAVETSDQHRRHPAHETSHSDTPEAPTPRHCAAPLATSNSAIDAHVNAAHDPPAYIQRKGVRAMTASINKNGVLAGKVAVVTGASRGIGEAIALRYAQEGAKVIVSARTVEEGDHILEGSINSVVKRIRDAGGEATAVRCDLAHLEDRENLIKAANETYGGVDILVNNAAITYFIPVEQFPEKRMKLMFEVQVYSPFHLAQMVIPGMRERGGGWILNISSHAALHPQLNSPGRGGTVYGMCKAALERFTTGLAAELHEDKIAVNVISPGLVATPGVMHHHLINESNKDNVTPVEHMAEACLRLSYGDASTLSGRITYADVMLKEFNLQPAELLA